METTLEPDAERSAVRVRLTGHLDANTAAEVWTEVERLARQRDLEHVTLDLAGVDTLDSAGVATLSMSASTLARAGKGLSVDGVRAEHRQILEMFRVHHEDRGDAGPPDDGPARPGRARRRAARAGSGVHFFVELLFDTVRVLAGGLLRPFRRGPSRRRQGMPAGHVVDQASIIGVDSLFILVPLGLILGFILAFQAIHELRQFGADIFVADLVGIGMVREMGGLLVAIIVAGRSGSAIAAELGTMAVREELDALRAMGIDPVRYLVAPRMLALTLVMPALTLVVIFLGLLGGYLGANLVISIPGIAYYHQTVAALIAIDFWIALFKSVIFAWIIGLTACYMGMRCRGGARSVGHVTTRSVVVSLFLIICSDSLVAALTTVTELGYPR